MFGGKGNSFFRSFQTFAHFFATIDHISSLVRPSGSWTMISQGLSRQAGRRVLWGVVAERRSRGADAAVLRALASACVRVCVCVRSVRVRAVYILDIIIIWLLCRWLCRSPCRSPCHWLCRGWAFSPLRIGVSVCR